MATPVGLPQLAEAMKKALGQCTKNSKILPHRAFIPCPFHRETNPSMSVNLQPDSPFFGSFFCFGCGEAGFWHRLAGAITGLDTDPNLRGLSFRSIARLAELQPVARHVAEPYYPDTDSYLRAQGLHYTSWQTCALPWRGFSPRQLYSVNAYAVYDFNPVSGERELMAFFPVEVLGSIRGGVRCAYNDKVYLNLKGEWRQDYGLLFFDQAVNCNRFFRYPFIVVCEGVRDALRLVVNGIPAVALLGTQGWTKAKSNLLMLASSHEPVEEIYLCFDSDGPGREAAAVTQQQLVSHLYVSTTDLVLPVYRDENNRRVKADVFALNTEDFRELVTSLREEHGWVGYDAPLC